MAAIQLSARDVAHLQAAQQALLSPMRHGDPIEWEMEANRAVRRLVGADHSIFSLPGGARPALHSDDTDPVRLEQFLEYCIGLERGEYRFRDPLLQSIGRARRAAGTGAFHELELGRREAIERSVAFQEIFIPAGLTNLVGFSTPLPVGEATQFFGFEGQGAERRSERGVALLQVLVPAFEAGVRVQRRRLGLEAALASTLDRAGEAAAVYSATAATLHRTRALRDLLSAEPEAERVWERMDALVRGLTARWRVPGKTADSEALPDARAEVRTRSAEYRLLGTYLDPEPLGAAGVLVLVRRRWPLLPTPVELRARFALTPREAEVALLLAQGLTDAAIAERLRLSRHTAHRYSERVLGKLALHSRAAVALTILRATTEAQDEARRGKS